MRNVRPSTTLGNRRCLRRDLAQDVPHVQQHVHEQLANEAQKPKQIPLPALRRGGGQHSHTFNRVQSSPRLWAWRHASRQGLDRLLRHLPRQRYRLLRDLTRWQRRRLLCHVSR